jgi:hypothetical protein
MVGGVGVIRVGMKYYFFNGTTPLQLINGEVLGFGLDRHDNPILGLNGSLVTIQSYTHYDLEEVRGKVPPPGVSTSEAYEDIVYLWNSSN